MGVLGKLIAACMLACAGCQGSEEPSLEEANPGYLADTTGLVWGWSCSDDDGYCRLSAPRSYWAAFGCEDADVGYIFFFSGYFQLCQSCGTPGATPVDDCRYLACASDSDCPQLTYYSTPRTYRCVENLCMNQEDPELAMSGANAEDLCVAEWPRSPGIWFDEAYLDLATQANEACPENDQACEVPEDCWPPEDYHHPEPPAWDQGEVIVTFEP